MKSPPPPAPTCAAAGLTLRFHRGTLELRGERTQIEELSLPTAGKWDARSACWRCPACHYADLLRGLHRDGVTVTDQARAYQTLNLAYLLNREPRDYQREALAAWRAAKGRGTVVLPTGAGKSLVAVQALLVTQRSGLIVAPTLELVRQWYELLSSSFGVPVGVIGGGEYNPQELTVTTYDSAYLHVEQLGNRFGLVVFDEVHHLPSASYRTAAQLSLAPYRLGLTATPERQDGLDQVLDELIGPVVYQREITELSGEYLADYDTRRISVELSEEERAEYDEARAIYLGFVRSQGLRLGGASGWNEFVRRASRSEEGRRAFAAYRRQRTLAVAARSKLESLEELLFLHRRDRVIIFTLDNATAYAISRRFLVPVITHQTRMRERIAVLSAFASGELGAVVTSKVLNEGVDVPDANVAVVVSGTGSVREHVQRLGRILRPKDGKRAVLYELISRNTAETQTSERRREHTAYKG